mgnify:CR=1 FL=1
MATSHEVDPPYHTILDLYREMLRTHTYRIILDYHSPTSNSPNAGFCRFVALFRYAQYGLPCYAIALQAIRYAIALFRYAQYGLCVALFRYAQYGLPCYGYVLTCVARIRLRSFAPCHTKNTPLPHLNSV